MTSTFPSLPLAPGEYQIEWLLQSGDRAPGTLDLSARSVPNGELYTPVVTTGVRVLGAAGAEMNELPGRLRTGHDIVAGQVAVQTWFPGRDHIWAEWVLVGLGIHAVAENQYPNARLQITGLDPFFGFAPIKSIEVPQVDEAAGGHFACEINDTTDESRLSGMNIRCAYDDEISGFDGYHFGIRAAPVIGLTSSQPLSVSDWITEWIEPLVGITTVATGHVQRLAWLTLSTHELENPSEHRPPSRTAQVFAGGISQAPYDASRPEPTPDALLRPFSLAWAPGQLATMVKTWRRRENQEDAFLELYGRDASRATLPPRAKFLSLIQALEALHATDNKAVDERAQARYEVHRNDVLEHVKSSGLSADDTKFLKKSLPKHRIENLADRLAELFDGVPGPIQFATNRLSTTPIAQLLQQTGTDLSVPAMLGELRNRLAHGRDVPPHHQFAEWIEPVEAIARVHLLKRLGVSDDLLDAMAAR